MTTTANYDAADERAVAYYADIKVTPELVDKWHEWKNNYVLTCMNRWVEQGTSRDEVLEGGASVLLELNSIDDVPWMQMGDAISIKLEASLFPGEMPWAGQKRIEFMNACRTLDICDERDQMLAGAYQMGVSVQHLEATAVSELPSSRCAVYRHFDSKGVLLYVGIANDPSIRSSQHKATAPWHRFSDEVTVEWFDTRAQADAAERAAIKNERPCFNLNHNVRNRKAATDYLFAALDGGRS